MGIVRPTRIHFRTTFVDCYFWKWLELFRWRWKPKRKTGNAVSSRRNPRPAGRFFENADAATGDGRRHGDVAGGRRPLSGADIARSTALRPSAVDFAGTTELRRHRPAAAPRHRTLGRPTRQRRYVQKKNRSPVETRNITISLHSVQS